MFGKRSGPTAGNGAQAQPAPAARPAAVSPTPGAMQPRTETPASPPVIAEGGRQPIPSAGLGAPLVPAPTPGRRPSSGGNSLPSPPIAPTATDSRHTESYYETKGMVFGALIEAKRALLDVNVLIHRTLEDGGLRANGDGQLAIVMFGD